MGAKAAAFVHANMGSFIAAGSTVFAALSTTGTIIYDNHRGRKAASADIDSKIEGVKRELREEIGGVKRELKEDIGGVKQEIEVINTRIGAFNSNLITIGTAIMKAQNGDKEHSRKLLHGLTEACKESGGC